MEQNRPRSEMPSIHVSPMMLSPSELQLPELLEGCGTVTRTLALSVVLCAPVPCLCDVRSLETSVSLALCRAVALPPEAADLSWIYLLTFSA